MRRLLIILSLAVLCGAAIGQTLRLTIREYADYAAVRCIQGGVTHAQVRVCTTRQAVGFLDLDPNKPLPRVVEFDTFRRMVYNRVRAIDANSVRVAWVAAIDATPEANRVGHKRVAGLLKTYIGTLSDDDVFGEGQ